MRPIVLSANRPPDRFYRGGERIDAFRSRRAAPPPPSVERVPEDWIASATTLFGEQSLGLSTLPDGERLRDALSREPEKWLGSSHVARYGANPALLVKLLDAGQRLPVHVHPDRLFAERELGLAHGKTEAWIALAPGDVRVCFNRDVGTSELADWVARQDVPEILAAMHQLSLAPGDCLFIPAGTPHAIGEGCFVVELQEPTDLSIMLEWDGFDMDGRVDGHLGIGHERALAAVDRSGWTTAEVQALRLGDAATTGSLYPGAEEFFRADRVRGAGEWEAGFAIVVVVSGSGRLRTETAAIDVREGNTIVVPFAAGKAEIDGEVEIILCRPPTSAESVS